MVESKTASKCKKHDMVMINKQIRIDNVDFCYSGAYFVILVCRFCKSYEVKKLELVGEKNEII